MSTMKYNNNGFRNKSGMTRMECHPERSEPEVRSSGSPECQQADERSEQGSFITTTMSQKILRDKSLIMTMQSGRSMVEMLGVLAIFGVLSVVGIAGLQSAMDSHTANEIVAALNRRTTLLMANKSFGQPLEFIEPNELGYTWTLADNETYIDIGVQTIAANVCRKVHALTQNWKSVYVYPDCSFFSFKADLSDAGAATITCGPCAIANPVSNICIDDDSLCGSSQTCYNGYCSDCAKEHFKNNTGGCSQCGSSQVSSKNECNRCPNNFYSNSGKCQACNLSGQPSNRGYQQTDDREECLHCPGRVWDAASKYCVYCDPAYSEPNEERSACEKHTACASGYYFAFGTCIQCGKIAELATREACNSCNAENNVQNIYCAYSSYLTCAVVEKKLIRDVASTDCVGPRRYWMSGNMCAYCPDEATFSNGTCSCPANTYLRNSSSVSSNKCVSCPVGTTAPAGSTKASDCVAQQ